MNHKNIRAARGNKLSCKGWQQEAALRMLMNNLDPEVAERPEELVVHQHAQGRFLLPALARKFVAARRAYVLMVNFT